MTSDSFIRNINHEGKNFLVIDPWRRDGYVHISHDCMTDDEIGETVDDYCLGNEMQMMNIGDTIKVDSYSFESIIIIRIS